LSSKDKRPKHNEDSFFSIQGRRRKRTTMKVLLPIVGLAITIGVLAYYYPPQFTNNIGVGTFGTAHSHTAFMLVLDGRIVDFTKPEYMVKDDLIHLEDMEGDVIHRHASEVNIGRFFSSLGMGSNHSGCFTGDDGIQYCDEPSGKRLRLWVDGEELQGHAENYIPEQNHRVLLLYGDEDQQQVQQYLSTLNEIEIMNGIPDGG